nr:odorant receptor 2 [Pachyrhinus yasumatsui]
MTHFNKYKYGISKEILKKTENVGLLQIPRVCMYLAGMWPIEQIKNRRIKRLFLIYKYFIFTYYFIFNILLIIEFLRLVQQQKEFERISNAAGEVVTLSYLWVKAIIFHRNKIPQNFLLLLKYEKYIWKSKDKDVTDLYKMILKYCRYFNSCVIFFAIFTVIFFYVIHIAGSEGILNLGIEYWDFEKRAFMHEIYFPFDKKHFFYFIFGCNILYTILTIFLYVSCQTILYVYIIFAITRLMILQISLKKTHILAEDAHVDRVIIMKICIKEHQDLIRLVNILNHSIKSLFLMDFLLNSFKVAFNLFQVMKVTSLSDLLFPLLYALMITWEVVSIGCISNEIKIQSLGIADASYQSLWYKENKNTKRLVNILIMRAQRPLTLTIGPLQPMTTETIITILKAAYSYVTLMMDY